MRVTKPISGALYRPVESNPDSKKKKKTTPSEVRSPLPAASTFSCPLLNEKWGGDVWWGIFTHSYFGLVKRNKKSLGNGDSCDWETGRRAEKVVSN